MKFSSGKRIGQSGQQLTTAVLFSSILHAILFLTVLFLHFAVMPRVSIPPFYAVKLVGLPSETPAPVQAPSTQAPVAPRKHAAKPAPPKHQAKKGPEKAAKTAKKSGLPDLKPSTAPRKPAVEEQEKASEPQAPPSSKPSAGPAASKSESVSVAAQQSDFKFGYYLERVRNKIGQNWNPPPDAPEARVRVIFSVNRSGWIGEVRLDEKESTATFQFRQAAIRAIHASNPFPQLPEEFSKQKLDFSVDLTAVQ